MNDLEASVGFLARIANSYEAHDRLAIIAEQEDKREYSFIVFKRYGKKEFIFSPIYIGDEFNTFPEGLKNLGYWDWEQFCISAEFKENRNVFLIEPDITAEGLERRLTTNHYELINVHTHPVARKDVACTLFSRGDLTGLRATTEDYSKQFGRAIKPIDVVCTNYGGELLAHMIQQKNETINEYSFNALFEDEKGDSWIDIGYKQYLGEVELRFGKSRHNSLEAPDLYFEYLMRKLAPYYNFATINPNEYFRNPRYFERGSIKDFEF